MEREKLQDAGEELGYAQLQASWSAIGDGDDDLTRDTCILSSPNANGVCNSPRDDIIDMMMCVEKMRTA